MRGREEGQRNGDDLFLLDNLIDESYEEVAPANSLDFKEP